MRTHRPVLAVSSQLPWPLDRGGHIRTFSLLRAVAQEFSLRLVAGCAPGHETSVSALNAAGIAVHAATLPARRPLAEARRAVGAARRSEPYVFFHRHNRRQVAAAIREEIARERPEVAYLDHLDSWLFADLFDDIPIVVDLHNVYSLLVGREATDARWTVGRLYLEREARLLARIERVVAERATMLLAVSKEEQDHFRALGAGHVALVPNGVDCDLYRDLPTGRSGHAPLILYLGSMSWPPNVNAAHFLATEVMPRLRTLAPNARLRIVGRNPLPAVLALQRHDGVEVAGEVPDVRPHLREASLLAVPLEVGGGTRLKILEAFAAGLPVVSTPVGSEGLDVVDGTHLTIADRPQFTDAIAALVRDDAVGLGLATEARQLARDRYDWSAIGNLVRAVVRAC